MSLKKSWPSDAFELERVVLETFDDLVLLIVGEVGETLAAVFAAARAFERGERLAVLLRGCNRRLHALLFGAGLERSHHVKAFIAALRPGELPVDKHGAAAVLAAWRFRVRRNQAINDCLYGPGFLGCEIVPAARDDGDGGIGGGRLPGQTALYDDRTRRR